MNKTKNKLTNLTYYIFMLACSGCNKTANQFANTQTIDTPAVSHLAEKKIKDLDTTPQVCDLMNNNYRIEIEEIIEQAVVDTDGKPIKEISVVMVVEKQP